ncbi:ATP-binding cassette domain-containing protein [Propioniciclava coleopterorum]|uniref:ATP-binding cassette domain-containing protein n=1 Tax=Propioniciclava coleopterorum TaxID=2714937 RepID=A0A6G7Y2E7_9ACTN|nr:ATP-binding cassette domain-containing protein [Propioniciclava coleopterorum]QIK70982.1 ATP-binding cassette domain-containing protein [Propioniciclava coleopterorum]
MIEVTSLTKVYPSGAGSVTAVDDVSLHVGTGRIFGILGRSGAGKTTLMRCLTALERPTSGQVTIGDVELTTLSASQLRAARHRMGMIFQHFNLLNSRTAAGNIAFPLEVQGVPAAERSARVAELIDLVGLQGRADAFPSQLSGGQKQRVGIARALAAHPEVLFCDEATSALDPATTEQILDLIKEINARTGVTVVLITHESEVVRRICDGAALMEAGRVVEQGDLLDLLTDPTSRLADILLPVGDPALAGVGESVVLSFAQGNTQEAVISALTRRFGLDVSIVGGAVEAIAGRKVGRLRVALSHPEGHYDRAAVASYLAEHEVSVQL